MERKKTFKEEFDTWPVERIEEWLAMGAAALANRDERTMRWLLAFHPLQLLPQEDVADQIIGALYKVSPNAYHKARIALTNVLNALPSRLTPTEVELLIRISGSVRPRGLAVVARNLLSRQLIINELAAWEQTFGAAVVALADYPYDPMFSDFIDDLRASKIWRPIFARYYISAHVQTYPRDWLNLSAEFEPDLVWLRDNDSASVKALALQLAERCGVRRIARDVHLPVVDKYKHLRWFADILISCFDVVVEGDKLFLVRNNIRWEVRRSVVDELDKETREEWYTFLDTITPHPTLNAQQAMAETLKKISA
jgi:hypothetical protein